MLDEEASGGAFEVLEGDVGAVAGVLGCGGCECFLRVSGVIQQVAMTL